MAPLIYNLAVIHEVQAPARARPSLILLKLSARHEILIKECAQRKSRQEEKEEESIYGTVADSFLPPFPLLERFTPLVGEVRQ